ncbi:hypothetical protein L2U69_07365 [Zavarzinia compransoris]|uniref:hypothetical protein n=1 Tax=Zavarzinia marina TaxID=2911065 RepID=UPI001F38DB7E|nr:hypothetical protein [Zavarzinia marina]MCF4165456.1 hypothetical protein [Zavarzinia marina]
MPVPLLVLMLQSAFRVVFERESLRLAFLLGVVPAIGSNLAVALSAHWFGSDPSMDSGAEINVEALGGMVIAASAGFVLSLFLVAPFAAKAAGDLLARRLGRPPEVTPQEATRRAWLVLVQMVAAALAVVALNVAVSSLMPAASAAGVFVGTALLFLDAYFLLGLALAPAQLFYGPSADLRLSFSMMRGGRLRILAFVVIVALPFLFASNLISVIAGAQPAGAWVITILVSLVSGFVAGLSNAPHLIGIVQAYFAKTGEDPPIVADAPED